MSDRTQSTGRRDASLAVLSAAVIVSLGLLLLPMSGTSGRVVHTHQALGAPGGTPGGVPVTSGSHGRMPSPPRPFVESLPTIVASVVVIAHPVSHPAAPHRHHGKHHVPTGPPSVGGQPPSGKIRNAHHRGCVPIVPGTRRSSIPHHGHGHQCPRGRRHRHPGPGPGPGCPGGTVGHPVVLGGNGSTGGRHPERSRSGQSGGRSGSAGGAGHHYGGNGGSGGGRTGSGDNGAKGGAGNDHGGD